MFPKKLIALCLSGVLITSQATAGIPVADPSNLTPNMIGAIQNIKSVIQQALEYEKQLEQLSIMARNIKIPSPKLWNEVNGLITDMNNSYALLRQYKSELKNMSNTLKNFKTSEFYKQHSCFQVGSKCTRQQLVAIAENIEKAEKSQNNIEQILSTTAIKNIEGTTKQLQQLRKMGQEAASSGGQLEALQHLNKFNQATNANLVALQATANQAALAQSVERQRQADERARAESFYKQYGAGGDFKETHNFNNPEAIVKRYNEAKQGKRAKP